MRFLLSAVLVTILFLAAPVKAQEQKMDQAEQMKIWQEYMTPGENHKMMAETTGDWTFKLKMWMDPSKEPELYDGTSTNEMIMGGRYLRSVQKGNMMNMPYEGEMLEGFDNASKEFTAVWVDNMGTGVMVAKGTYDPASKMLTLKGSVVDPMTKKDSPFKEVFTILDKNNHRMEFYMLDGDKETKTMEITYTRK